MYRIALELLSASLSDQLYNRQLTHPFEVYATGALSAVQGLHADGFIHRDIKLEVSQ